MLKNTMLMKSRKDIVEVEKCRTIRVEKNMQKKREDKGLITVHETMNESDPNRTNANMTPSTPNILKHTQTGIGKEIIEEKDERDDSYSIRMFT